MKMNECKPGMKIRMYKREIPAGVKRCTIDQMVKVPYEGTIKSISCNPNSFSHFVTLVEYGRQRFEFSPFAEAELI